METGSIPEGQGTIERPMKFENCDRFRLLLELAILNEFGVTFIAATV